jgi:hypothetical protein
MMRAATALLFSLHRRQAVIPLGSAQPRHINTSFTRRCDRKLRRPNALPSRPRKAFRKREAATRSPALFGGVAAAGMIGTRVSFFALVARADRQWNAGGGCEINGDERGTDRAPAAQGIFQDVAEIAQHRAAFIIITTIKPGQ